MTRTGGITAEHFIAALAAGDVRHHPYPHRLIRQVLPDDLARRIAGLSIDCPAGLRFDGRRETNNPARIYFTPTLQGRFPAALQLAAALQTPAAVAAIENACGIELRGSLLRIEYCLDRDGFWLEPHTDIAAKRLTMMVYLSLNAVGATWGTDLYDEDRRWQATAPGEFNSGLVFVPAGNSWHGVERRRIDGIRRSLMINYVVPEWRAREELAFPDRPV